MKKEDREELAKSLIAGVCVFCCVIAAPYLIKLFGWLYTLAVCVDSL